MTLDPGHELRFEAPDVPSTYSFGYGYLSGLVQSYLLGDMSRETFARCTAEIDIQVQANLNRVSMQCYQAGITAGRAERRSQT